MQAVWGGLMDQQQPVGYSLRNTGVGINGFHSRCQLSLSNGSVELILFVSVYWSSGTPMGTINTSKNICIMIYSYRHNHYYDKGFQNLSSQLCV